MNETNILSVDFDWIMEPSIRFYDEFAYGTRPLDEFLKESPGVTVKPDFKKYERLAVYLRNVAATIAEPMHIAFFDDHDMIVNCINDIWKIGNKPYNIYNIDHHHDCGYGVQSLQDIDEQGLTCGNWVAHCTNLKDYTWINNKNSQVNIIDEVFKRFRRYQHTNDIRIVDYVKFDYVFFCLSPGWMPSELFPLYDVIHFDIEKSYEGVEVNENKK